MPAGLLLAAGEGRRYGQPKALADTGAGPWVLTTLSVMAGLSPLVVVTGAADAQVRALLPAEVRPVFNPDFKSGMASSLVVGLSGLQDLDVDAVVVMLVDLPDVSAAVLSRVAAAAGAVPRQALARAIYRGVPGHPVLLGAEHFPELIRTATGDRGARDYLAGHPVDLVECGDVGSGRDVDRPDQV